MGLEFQTLPPVIPIACTDWHLIEHLECQDHRKDSDWKGSQVIVVQPLPCEAMPFLSSGVESLCSNNAF